MNTHDLKIKTFSDYCGRVNDYNFEKNLDITNKQRRNKINNEINSV